MKEILLKTLVTSIKTIKNYDNYDFNTNAGKYWALENTDSVG